MPAENEFELIIKPVMKMSDFDRNISKLESRLKELETVQNAALDGGIDKRTSGWKEIVKQVKLVTAELVVQNTGRQRMVALELQTNEILMKRSTTLGKLHDSMIGMRKTTDSMAKQMNSINIAEASRNSLIKQHLDTINNEEVTRNNLIKQRSAAIMNEARISLLPLAERNNLRVLETLEIKRQQAAIAGNLKLEKEMALEIAKRTKAPAGRGASSGTTNGKAGFFGTMFGDAGTSFGHKIATTAQYAAAGAGIYGVTGALTGLGKAIIESDKYLHMFMGVLEMSGKEAKNLQQDIFNVGKEIGGTSQGMAEAALMLGRAGIENEKLAEGLRVASMAANIAGDSIQNITEMFAAWKTVYPDAEITHLGDMMAKIANESLLSIDGLKTATSYITATGAAAGVTADSLIQLAGAWKQTGKADSIVGTEMRRFFMMVEGGSKDASKAYWQLGIDLEKTDKLIKRSQDGTAEGAAVSQAAMSDMMKKIREATPEQLKAFEEVKNGMSVLEKQTTNSSLIAAREYGRMEKAAQQASGSLNIASGKIALSYEKMMERIVFVIKEGSSKFEEGFKDSFAGATATEEDFKKRIEELSKTIQDIATSAGGALGSISGFLVDQKDVIIELTSLYVAYKTAVIGGGIVSAIANITTGIKAARDAQIAFNATALANPYVLGATAILGTIYAITRAHDAMGEAAAKAGEKAGEKWFSNDAKTIEKAVTLTEQLAIAKELERNAEIQHGKSIAKLNERDSADNKLLVERDTKRLALIKARIDLINKEILGTKPAAATVTVDVGTVGEYTEKEKNGAAAKRAKQEYDIEQLRLKVTQSRIEAELKGDISANTRRELQTQLAQLEDQKVISAWEQYDLALKTTKLKGDAKTEEVLTKEIALNAAIGNLNEKYATELTKQRQEKENIIQASQTLLSVEAKLANLKSGKTETNYERIDREREALDKKLESETDATKALAIYTEVKQKDVETENERIRQAEQLVQAQETLNNVVSESIALNMSVMDTSDTLIGYTTKQSAGYIRQREAMQSLTMASLELEGSLMRQSDAYKNADDATKAFMEEIQKKKEEMLEFRHALDDIEDKKIKFEIDSSGLDGTMKTLADLGKASKVYFNNQEDLKQKEMSWNARSAKAQKKYDNAWFEGFATKGDEEKAWGELNQENADINQERQTAEIAGYANLAGAIGSAFEEGSGAAKAFQAIQATLGIVNGITAITNAWGSAPFPANMPAVATTTAAVIPLIGQLASLGGSSGSGGGGVSTTSSTGQSYEANREDIEAEYTPITDRLDRQIELLERLNLQGTASLAAITRADVGFERDYSLFKEDTLESIRKSFDLRVIEYQGFSAQAFVDEMERIDDLISGELFTSVNVDAAASMSDAAKGFLDEDILREGDNMLVFLAEASKSIYGQMALVDDMHTNWGENLQDTETYFANTLNEIFELTAEYANNMLDVMDELKDASETMKESYDNLTGSMRYETERLTQAFDEFDMIRGESSYADYLQEQITSIDELNAMLDGGLVDLLLSEDPTRIAEQVEAIEALGEASGRVFEGGAEEALNYLESIELVAEAMATSRENIKSWEDSFKTDEQLLDDLFKGFTRSYEELVSDFYSTTLGREVDTASLDYWVGALEDGTLEVADLYSTMSEAALNYTKVLGEIPSIYYSVATSMEELDELFIKLSNDAEGLTDAELELIEANKALLESTEELSKQLRSAFDTIVGTIEPNNNMNYKQAQSDLFRMVGEARAGILPTEDELSSVLASVTSNTLENYASMSDYLKDQKLTANAIAELEGLTDTGLTVEQNMLTELQSQTEYLQYMATVYEAYAKLGLSDSQTDISGYNYWANELMSGNLDSTNYIEAIKNATPTIDGSHYNGLPYVPYDGYIAELHKGKAVVPAKAVKASQNMEFELIKEIQMLRAEVRAVVDNTFKTQRILDNVTPNKTTISVEVV